MAERKCRPTDHDYTAIRENESDETCFLYCAKCGDYRVSLLSGRAQVPEVFRAKDTET